MKVICINDGNLIGLTKNKEYKVCEKSNKYFTTINDQHEVKHYSSILFKEN
jgi:hypothetical protein